MAKKKRKSKALFGWKTGAGVLAGIVGLHLLEKRIGSPIPFTRKGTPNYVAPPEHPGAGTGMGYGSWDYRRRGY